MAVDAKDQAVEEDEVRAILRVVQQVPQALPTKREHATHQQQPFEAEATRLTWGLPFEATVGSNRWKQPLEATLPLEATRLTWGLPSTGVLP